MKLLFSRRQRLAFTLVELLVVMAIILLLMGLSLPSFQSMMLKAQSSKCSSNLRQIGIAVTQAATDNNNQYPEIDQAAAPIYTPPGPNLVTALGPYGITTDVVKCPVDIGQSPSAFQQYGSSYEWDPVFDDESVTVPVVYIRPTVPVPVNNTRVRLVMDFNGIHRGRSNTLYGDGHVTSH